MAVFSFGKEKHIIGCVELGVNGRGGDVERIRWVFPDFDLESIVRGNDHDVTAIDALVPFGEKELCVAVFDV